MPESYVLLNPGDRNCKPCSDRGHVCNAHALVDGEPFCAWCLDGETCPKAGRSNGKPLQGNRGVAEGVTWPPPPDSLRAKEVQKTAAKIAEARRICKVEGCFHPLRSTNQTGICSACQVAGRKAGDVIRRCKECSVILRKNTPGDYCQSCTAELNDPRLEEKRAVAIAEERESELPYTPPEEKTNWRTHVAPCPRT